MTQTFKDKIADIAKIIGAIAVIQGAVIAVATPFINEHIEQQIKEYHNSADFKLYVDEVIEQYRNETNNTSTVSLRDLLSDKMGVPPDEVHIKLGEMYRHRGDLKEHINEIIREIEFYHPTTILSVH